MTFVPVSLTTESHIAISTFRGAGNYICNMCIEDDKTVLVRSLNDYLKINIREIFLSSILK